jgi:hypothetical protein
VESRVWHGGERHLVRFPNGYAASVIRGPFSYGGPDGLWEVAVMIPDGEDPEEWEITYDTPITSNVLGWLDVPGVAGVLLQVSRLPVRPLS